MGVVDVTFRPMATVAAVAAIAIMTMTGSAVADTAAPSRLFGFGQPGGPMVPPLPAPIPVDDPTDEPSTPADEPDVPKDADSLGVFELTLSTGVEKAVSVTLTCRPEGGTHPGDIATACAQLSEAAGDVTAINASGMLCTKQFDPVTARMHGTWDGREVRYERQFGNACEANAATGGSLFGFWDAA